MKITEAAFKGVYIVENFYAEDNRGIFVKTFHEDTFLKHGLCTEFKENFYTVSKKGTIRGMHFQLPPDDHVKLVYVISGAIEDVLLDLRKTSTTFGQTITIDIDARHHISVYIPKGIAHGFKSKEDNTVVVYHVSTMHNPKNDYGIRYDSFGYDWQLKKPFMSERDQKFSDFIDFKGMNPF